MIEYTNIITPGEKLQRKQQICLRHELTYPYSLLSFSKMETGNQCHFATKSAPDFTGLTATFRVVRNGY